MTLDVDRPPWEVVFCGGQVNVIVGKDGDENGVAVIGRDIAVSLPPAG